MEGRDLQPQQARAINGGFKRRDILMPLLKIDIFLFKV
jgi:hypothetical protein